MARKNEKKFEEMLRDVLGAEIDKQIWEEDDAVLMPVSSTWSFAGFEDLGDKAGLLVQLDDGRTFQVSIEEIGRKK